MHADIVQVNVFTKTDIKLRGMVQYGKNDYETFQSLQLNCLRNIMGSPRGAPIAALYLELGILPIKYEIEMRQILYLKKVLKPYYTTAYGLSVCEGMNIFAHTLAYTDIRLE